MVEAVCGRTVQKIVLGDSLLIAFTDGSCVGFQVNDDAEIEEFVPGTYDQMILGLKTFGDWEAELAAEGERVAKEAKEKRRREYESLKREFEGQS